LWRGWRALAPGGVAALANRTDGSGLKPLTRCGSTWRMPRIQPHIHAVRPVELVARASGHCPRPRPDYDQLCSKQDLTTHTEKSMLSGFRAWHIACRQGMAAGLIDGSGQRPNAADIGPGRLHGNEKKKTESQAIALSLNDGAPGQAVVWSLLAL
jgi:hypothetical protein